MPVKQSDGRLTVTKPSTESYSSSLPFPRQMDIMEELNNYGRVICKDEKELYRLMKKKDKSSQGSKSKQGSTRFDTKSSHHKSKKSATTKGPSPQKEPNWDTLA